jgi:predicted anti-sigma-YlaC factor YlaD
MTCAMNMELASYALGSLAIAEHARVQQHVARCQACRDELADLAGVIGVLRRITTDQIDSLPGQLSEHLPPTDRRPRASLRQANVAVGVAVGVAMLALLAMVAVAAMG